MSAFIQSGRFGAPSGSGPVTGSADAGILAGVMFTVSGTTVTVQDQKNVASVTRRAAGVYTVTFNSTLSHANYGVAAMARLPNGSADTPALCRPRRNSTSGWNTYSTTSVDIDVSQANWPAPQEASSVSVVVYDPANLGSLYPAAAFFTLSGTTVTLQKQKNVSSVSRAAAGAYGASFSSAMSSADYSAFTGARYADFTNDAGPLSGANRQTSRHAHSTTALDMVAGLLYAGIFDVGNAGFIAMYADNPPVGTYAAVRFSAPGGVVAVTKSYNVTSVTRQAAGRYRIAFGTPMPDANYAVACDGKWATSTDDNSPCISPNSNTASSRGEYSTTQLDISAADYNGSLFDVEDSCDVWVFKPSVL